MQQDPWPDFAPPLDHQPHYTTLHRWCSSLLGYGIGVHAPGLKNIKVSAASVLHASSWINNEEEGGIYTHIVFPSTTTTIASALLHRHHHLIPPIVHRLHRSHLTPLATTTNTQTHTHTLHPPTTTNTPTTHNTDGRLPGGAQPAAGARQGRGRVPDQVPAHAGVCVCGPPMEGLICMWPNGGVVMRMCAGARQGRGYVCGPPMDMASHVCMRWADA